MSVNDYGLEILCAEEFPFAELLGPGLFSRENLAADTLESVNITQLAKMQFREIARVAGLVFQSYPGGAEERDAVSGEFVADFRRAAGV